MEELLKNWEREMIRARQAADKQIDEPTARTKAMQKFMCLRDCIKDLKQALDLASVGDMCPSHKPHLEDSYIKRHEWAESQAKKGLEQKQCDKCKYWFFPSEF